MNSLRAVAALIFLTLLWGYTWVIAKMALAYSGPFAVGALRTVVGTLALFAALGLARQSLRLVAPGKTAVIGFFQTGGFIALSSWALVEGGAGRTAVLIFTMPIWTLILGRLWLGERLNSAQWFAAGCTLSGLMLVIAPWDMHSSALSKLLAVLAALSWAISTVLVKRWRQALSGDVLSLTAWQMVFGTLFLVVLALLVPEHPIDWSPAFFGILAVMGLVSTALGWFIWLQVLKRLPAWQASLSILGIPVVALLSSRLQLGEAIAASELAGIGLIGTGLLIVSYLNWRAQKLLAQS